MLERVRYRNFSCWSSSYSALFAGLRPSINTPRWKRRTARKIFRARLVIPASPEHDAFSLPSGFLGNTRPAGQWPTLLGLKISAAVECSNGAATWSRLRHTRGRSGGSEFD